MKEDENIHASRILVGKDGRIVIWRNNVGQAVFGKEHTCPRCKHHFRDEKPRRVTYGVGGEGGSDFLGIVKDTGRFIAWEFKGDGGRVSDDQQMFIDLVNRSGGAGDFIWSPDDVPAAIERACKR